MLQEKEIEGGNGAKLMMKGFPYKTKKNLSFILNISLNGIFVEKEICDSIKARGNMTKPQNTLLYKSEVKNGKMNNSGKILFEKSIIPGIYLAPDIDYNSNKVEVDINDSYHKKILCYYSGPIGKLISSNGETLQMVGGKNAVISVETLENYQFLEYIYDGMKLNFAIAIDFTGSNGNPDDPRSLHYLGNKANAYEIAIKSFGSIISYYNYEQLFLAFGFGGKFYGNPIDDHCFPLNGNPENPKISGIDGILQCYRTVLNNTHLFGPTYFHYIIDRVNSTAKEDVIENKMNYTILMILTDGIIEDMEDTIDGLVEASYLPISVIIIGIGNADFSNMDFLANHDEPLIDRNGRKSDRNIAQFFPFKDYSYNREQLVQIILKEISRQAIEYYQHQNINPKNQF